MSHSRYVCRATQLTCLLCHTADVSTVSHSRHVCEGKGLVSDKATDEKVPYICIYIYIIVIDLQIYRKFINISYNSRIVNIDNILNQI